MVTIAVVASVLIGYAALGSFLIDQAVWISAVVCILVMSTVLVDEGIAAGFRPSARLGRWLVIVGLRGNSLELTGILLGGIARLALFIVAALCWRRGLPIHRCSDRFRALFFASYCGITISFERHDASFFVMRVRCAVQEWLDSQVAADTTSTQACAIR
jgi:hypothetical protein